MDSLWSLNFLSSRIFLFSSSPKSIVSFIHRRTYASTFGPFLYFINVTTSSYTASCAAPVSLYVWVLPPRSPPTPLTASLLSLSVLVGGGLFFYLSPLVHHQLHHPAIYVYLMGGVGVDTWSPSRTPEFSVYVRTGGYWIKMVTRPFLYYVDNLSLVLVMEESFC